MKKNFKVISSLLLAVLMVFSLSSAVFAADATVTFKGKTEGFGFGPGSEYTATDLFDNFKNVMPGDKLTQNIAFKNEAADCSYIKVYLRAVALDENADLPTDSETVVTMLDFLAQLTMRIYNGTELIYSSSPDQTGALADNVYLGDLRSGNQLDLKVELDVPADLGNEYANRVGEVNWIFLVEAIESETLTAVKIWKDGNDPARPKSVNVNLLKDGEISETVELSADNQWTYTWDELDDRYDWSVEEETPKGYTVSYATKDNTIYITNSHNRIPKTGDESHLTLYVALMGVSALALVGVVFLGRKKRKKGSHES